MVSQEILLSIVTVSSGESSRLMATLTSLSQLPPEVEHIVVSPRNDPSNVQVAKFFTSHGTRNRKLAHDSGLGVYHAMNLGLSIAAGKYICYWNAGDELFDISQLNELLSFLRRIENQIVVLNGTIQNHPNYKVGLAEVEKFRLQKLGGYISHQTVLLNTSEFIKIGGFNTRFKVAADTDAIIYFVTRSKCAFFDRRIVSVESGNYSSMHNRRGRLEAYYIFLKYSKWDEGFGILIRVLSRESLFLFKKLASKSRWDTYRS